MIICSGASGGFETTPCSTSCQSGLAQGDDLSFGVKVDKFSRVIDAHGTTQSELFAFGPITRGTFGEMSGAPDILRQIERVIPAHRRPDRQLDRSDFPGPDRRSVKATLRLSSTNGDDRLGSPHGSSRAGEGRSLRSHSGC